MSWINNIKMAVGRRVPDLIGDQDLMEDLIDDAFIKIVSYSHADSYDRAWDKRLVRAVAMLYNNIGVEGSLGSSSMGIGDSYDSTDIIASMVAANIPQYVRPSGHVYPSTRFNYPQ